MGVKGCSKARLRVGPSDRLPVARGRRGFCSATTADRVEGPSMLVFAAVAETPPRVTVEEIHLVGDLVEVTDR